MLIVAEHPTGAWMVAIEIDHPPQMNVPFLDMKTPYRELQSQLMLETSKVNAREDVRRAFADLRASETALQLAKEQLAAAEAEYAQAFELYRAQETTSLDLASSETALADARRTVAEETLNHDLAQLRVWYAAGALQDAVGVQR